MLIVFEIVEDELDLIQAILEPLRTSGLSVHGLTVRNVPKSVDFHKSNEYNSSTLKTMFVCVAVLRPSQPNGVMSSAVSLPNHTFTGQA